MTIESACIPLPSEIIMPFSGFLVYSGKFRLWDVVFSGSLGNLIGSLMAYGIGYWGGRPLLLKYGKYILISPDEIEKADKWFARFGHEAVLISRNLPIIRTFISLPAGIAEMNIVKFSLYSFFGSIPWNFALTYAGLVLGANWKQLRIFLEKFDILIGIGLLVLVLLFIKYKLKSFR